MLIDRGPTGAGSGRRGRPFSYILTKRGSVKQIVDAKAQFRSLAEPWADTGTSTGRLMIAVLGGLADVERDLIRTRTAEGRSRARAHGQHMGRPPKLTPQQQKEARQRRGATLKELAQTYNVGRAAISRLTLQSA
jgi:DNA invertase Pin-like site-specific DNA recombinase